MIADQADPLPLRSHTPLEWGRAVLADPVSLLIDHAFLEKKAANNAMELLTRWPGEWLPGWVETMTSIARDETAHLAQVTRMLLRRGGRLTRIHKNPYANALRLLVRKGDKAELLDRLFVSALIEARSCERFGVLGDVADELGEPELAAFYRALYSSELGHYKVFLKLARKIAAPSEEQAHRPPLGRSLCAFSEAHRPPLGRPLCAFSEAHRPPLGRPLCAFSETQRRWGEMLDAEARVLDTQEPGSRIHSGMPHSGMPHSGMSARRM